MNKSANTQLQYHDNLDDLLVLVDRDDSPVGTATKLKAHEDGLLHRAFSVIVFNQTGQILLQKRAEHKYHSGGLWTNTCCSHPRPGEPVEKAVHRRLQEEMNFDCPVEFVKTLHYESPVFETGLQENELLHLYIGFTDKSAFSPDPEEVADWRWISPDALKKEVEDNPEDFSYWFRIYLDQFDFQALFSDSDLLSSK